MHTTIANGGFPNSYSICPGKKYTVSQAGPTTLIISF